MTESSRGVNPFHASEIAKVKPHQVFYSPGGRRGWVLLTMLVFVGCFVAVAIDWAQVASTQLPPGAARYNTSVNYPRQVADGVFACAKTKGQYGDNGALEVPVIGTGVFQRVVKIVPDGAVDYAVDPFTSQVYRPLTQLEAHAASRCGYAVEEYGTVPDHTIILTYDDGPEQPWTAKLLGILEAYHVHATFFNIGDSIIKYESAFKSVLAHGNFIGSHTLTHPELITLSNSAARSELVDNARIMAQVDGYHTRIWRTPYQGGDLVSTGNGMFDTLVGQQLGFTEVGFNTDTSDYALQGQEIPPPPLSRNPDSPGLVIIMHDGGGPRASTMVLSAKVIREAESDGYTFMTIPQLLAEQPGWKGPVTSYSRPTMVDTAGYWLQAYVPVFQNWYADSIRIMTVIIITISVLILLAAALDRWVSYRRPPRWHPDELGVLIPCWKESKVIRNTVERILECGAGCPFPIRIVLVDDGSADNNPEDKTWSIMCELAAEHPEVMAVQQHNGGKARALNFGLQYVTSDIVVVMDADTEPRDTESFTHLVRWFADSRVGAVAGFTKAGDRGKGLRQHFIAEFQAAEYDLGIALVRAVQNLSNGIVIVPGAFSAFRTEWLREVGYLPDRVVAEDAEAPQRMRRVRPRMRILQDLTAVAYTEVPLTFKVLRRQWRRWTIGVLQTLWEHREIFYRMDKYQLLTLQWWFALYGVTVPAIFLPLSYAMVIYGAASGTLGPIYLFPAIFIAFRAVQTIASMIILRSKMNPFVAIWYRFVNDPLQIYLTIVCFWMILSGRMPTTRKIWSQVPRSGVLVGGTVTRKVGVDAVQVPETAEVPQAVQAADTERALAAPELPQRVPADATIRQTEPIRISGAVQVPAAVKVTKVDWWAEMGSDGEADRLPGAVELHPARDLPEPEAETEPAALSDVSMSDHARLSENGLSENGLSENGLSEHGLSEHGLSEHDLSENGLSENGLSENGLSENGLSENGLSEHGLSEHGLSEHDLSENGLSEESQLTERG
jgi:cellulose synthase/poly-beta-1,6-N-acetylglucosamine synthase-like glycosyltransferase/peptidoglycan/xylan/chitin deacetylase (PgdA/CDA1 family)